MASLAKLQANRQSPSDSGPGESERDPRLELTQLGEYRMLTLLGKGGMGAVYLARHRRLDMIVAIKVLSDRRSDDPLAIARFEREMRAVGRLAHANIVRATDAGECEGRHYLAMEYVDGEDCQSILNRGEPPPIADACEIVRQAALGLQFAHEHDLVHRDIKPSNLMVDREGLVKVLDLGLARNATDAPGLSNDLQVMGTADYIAPEQIAAVDADHRADIYGLGCTLYALLCGVPPFAGHEIAFRKLKAHEQEQPLPVGELRNEIPAELSLIVEQALAKSPAERMPSAAEFASALEPFVVNAKLAELVGPTSRDIASGDTAPYDGYSTRVMPVDQPSSVMEPVSRGQRRTVQRTLIAGLALSAVLCVLTAIVLQFNTPEGSIRVEIDGTEIGASFVGEELLIEDRKTGNQYRLALSGDSSVKPLRPGDYSIRVVNQASGLRLETKRFQIVRDEQVVVSATIDPTPAVPEVNGKQLATAHDLLERKVAQWAWEHRAVVSVTDGERYFATGDENDLPEQFWIHRLDFQTPVELTDAEFNDLRKLPRLVELTFQDQVASDRFVNGLAAIPTLQLLEFRCITASTEGLERLAKLPSLNELRLKGPLVNNDQAAAASQLEQIYSLGLEGPRVTDEALLAIRNMTWLKVLSLHHTNITDDGLKHLQNLTKLELLFLAYTPVGDDCVQHLLKLKRLKWINLAETKITDAGIEELSQMNRLDRLTLMGLTISDTGLSSLAKVTSLRTLQFEGSTLTDANFDRLAELRQVTHMQLGNCLTADAVQALRLRLPNCRIDSDVAP